MFSFNFHRVSPQLHVELIKKIQITQKLNQKTLSTCLKELAVYEAEKLKATNPLPKWYSLHRKDGMDTDFNNTFLRHAAEILNGLDLLFLTAGDENGEKGNMILAGTEEVITDLGDQICSLLDGKGRGKGQRYQAKVNNLKKLSACEKLIKGYFEKK